MSVSKKIATLFCAASTVSMTGCATVNSFRASEQGYSDPCVKAGQVVTPVSPSTPHNATIVVSEKTGRAYSVIPVANTQSGARAVGVGGGAVAGGGVGHMISRSGGIVGAVLVAVVGGGVAKTESAVAYTDALQGCYDKVRTGGNDLKGAVPDNQLR